METREIRHIATLDYCDGVQLFAAEDDMGSSYVAALVSIGHKADRYLVVGCESKTLLAFRAGSTDLLSLFRHSSEQGWYIADVTGFDKPIRITHQEGISIPDEMMPGVGFYLDGKDANQKETEEDGVLDG